MLTGLCSKVWTSSAVVAIHTPLIITLLCISRRRLGTKVKWVIRHVLRGNNAGFFGNLLCCVNGTDFFISVKQFEATPPKWVDRSSFASYGIQPIVSRLTELSISSEAYHSSHFQPIAWISVSWGHALLTTFHQSVRFGVLCQYTHARPLRHRSTTKLPPSLTFSLSFFHSFSLSFPLFNLPLPLCLSICLYSPCYSLPLTLFSSCLSLWLFLHLCSPPPSPCCSTICCFNH